MGTTQLEPLTVLFVSANGRVPTAGESMGDADSAMDVVVVDSTDGAEARLRDGDVHCVVCEHDPPRVDGIGFVAAVRESGSSLPLLVVPADETVDCARDALAAGATDVVETPSRSVSPAVLANRIRTLAESGVGRTIQPTSANGSGPPSRAALQGDDALADHRLERIADAIQTLRTVDRRDAVGDVVVDVLTELLAVPGAGVFYFDDERNYLEPVAITDRMAEYYGGETAFGPNRPDSITWRVFVTGEGASFDDVRTADDAVNEDTDARASVFVPLGEHGTVVVSTDVVGAFSDSARRVVELVAAVAGATLDRIASEDVARQRERQLRRQADRLRVADRTTELARELDRAIVRATTRIGVERGVLDCLGTDERVDFAWIGSVDPDSNTLVPRAWTEGGDEYVDDLAPSSHGSGEPAARTARTRSVTHVPNVAEHLDGDWERTSLSKGFHCALSVPLTYEGTLYGVLTMYADRPNAFQDPFPAVVAQASETAAHAINAAERSFCMVSDSVTELDLRVEDDDGVLSVVAANAGTAIECQELEPRPDGSATLRFSAVDVSAESVLSTTAGLETVDSVTHVASDDAHQFTAVVDQETIGSAMVAAGGVPVSITADGTALDVTVSIPPTVEPRTFVNRMERRYRNVTLLARRQRNPVTLTRTGFRHELESVLTDRQMEVLRTAYDSGFFESPRNATGQDVADLLDVSQPTVSHHLRESQGKLFSLLFDGE